MTQSFFWTTITPEGLIRVGLSDYGREQIGQVKYIELPHIGQILKPGDSFLDLEAEKVVRDLTSELAGTVTAVHQEITTAPELLTSERPEDNWLFDLQP